MNTYRDLLEAGGGASGFCPQSAPVPPAAAAAFCVPNGHSPGPGPAPSPGPAPAPKEPPGPARSSVPKMGVRARIAEWPPRRARSRESLLENGHGAAGAGGGAGLVRGGVARLPHRRSRDTEFRDGPGGGASRPTPLRQRSSSEVTLSEQDEAEADARADARAGLLREYGSTSSIDAQAVPDHSFFHMLSQFHQERPDQRSTAPARLGELLRAQASPPAPPASHDDGGGSTRPESRVRKKSGGTESSLGTSSLFRKLRGAGRTEAESGRGEGEEGRPPEAGGRSWLCPRSFAHYDVQSLLFDLHEAAAQRAYVSQPRNTPTGASAATLAASRAAAHAHAPAPAPDGPEPSHSSTEDLLLRDPPDPEGPEPGDCPNAPANAGQLLLGCPHFRNETGGHGERNVSFLSSSGGAGGAGHALALRRSNASVSLLEVEPEQSLGRLEALQQYSIEHVDQGARYYRDHFHGKEHWDYFGTDDKLGPVALSIRREKLEDSKELRDQYQYRLIFRSSELVTLRGSVLEDAVPSTARHGVVRGLPLKEVLEHVVPELNVACLRLALPAPKVSEQLLRLDEQGLSQKHKVGILLCRSGQSTEEEMYNNEEATPAFRHFQDLLGEQVCLRGFTKYAAQLDTKTDSTGTHSLYTTYQNYEVMFHVSTMLPYMPSNPQQLLRKRHIGNDIVTIIFQEPGALPFTPQNIRSHFQHVFVIVRVHNPCTDSTYYSVAVTRMKDVPPFGPPIPTGATFRDPALFRDFLLAKVINAENAAHKSEKFHTMATRTRQEYLRDLAENCVSGTPLDSAGKLNNFILLASKKRERARAREGAELGAAGAVAWRVQAQDFSGGGAELACILAVSREYVLLLDTGTKEVVFNCFCTDIIGWTPERLALKIYYGRGDHVAVRVPEGYGQDLREVVTRLKDKSSGISRDDLRMLFFDLFPGFHKNMLERYLTDELRAVDKDFTNSVDFQEFLGLYKRLFIQCRSVVCSDVTDAIPTTNKFSDEKICTSPSSKIPRFKGFRKHGDEEEDEEEKAGTKGVDVSHSDSGSTFSSAKGKGPGPAPASSREPKHGDAPGREAPPPARKGADAEEEEEEDEDEGDSFFDDPLPRPKKTFGCNLAKADKSLSEASLSENGNSRKEAGRSVKESSLSRGSLPPLRKSSSLNDLSAIDSDTDADDLFSDSDNGGGYSPEPVRRRADPGRPAGSPPPPPREGPRVKSGEPPPPPRDPPDRRTGNHKGSRDSKAMNSRDAALGSDEDNDYDDDFNSHRSDNSRSEMSIGEEIEEVSIEGPDLSDKLDDITQDLSLSQLSQGADYMEEVS